MHFINSIDFLEFPLFPNLFVMGRFFFWFGCRQPILLVAIIVRIRPPFPSSNVSPGISFPSCPGHALFAVLSLFHSFAPSSPVIFPNPQPYILFPAMDHHKAFFGSIKQYTVPPFLIGLFPWANVKRPAPRELVIVTSVPIPRRSCERRRR